MSKAGRKRKAGKREPNGRLSRIDVPRFDTGTDRARLKFSQYGTEGADAIGRAHAHGLLGPDADNLRDTARKIARAYWPMLEVGSYRCTLNDGSGGANDNSDETAEDRSARIKRREEWLSRTLRTVDVMDTARRHRSAFDGLVIDVHPDSGPRWLDAIIWAKGHGREPLASDLAILERAKAALVEVMT